MKLSELGLGAALRLFEDFALVVRSFAVAHDPRKDASLSKASQSRLEFARAELA